MDILCIPWCNKEGWLALLKRGSRVKGKGEGSSMRVNGKGKGSRVRVNGKGRRSRVRVKGEMFFFIFQILMKLEPFWITKLIHN